jgi:large subunit ribosomal protein L9
MKIILLQDVYKKGVAGEVVDVAPGYARNFLIPRGMAVKATPGGLRQFEHLRQHSDIRRAERDQEYQQIAEKIEGLTLYFGMKAGETGKLYGSVTATSVAEQLKEEIGLEIDRRRIGDRSLRELGEFFVPVRLEAGLIPAVKVVIFREGTDPHEMEAVKADEAEVAEVETGAAEVETEAAEMLVESESEADEPIAEADEVAEETIPEED